MSKKKLFTTKNEPAEKDLFLTPSKTAFDYLEGAFAKSERSRLIGIILPGLALVALGGVAAFGAIATLEADSERASLATAEANNRDLSSELAVLDSAGGFPTATLVSHVESRTAAVGEVLKGEIAFVKILKDLQASTPNGVTITAVNFKDSASSGDDDKESSSADVSITAEATSFELISTWVKNLEEVPAITDTDVDWSGGGDKISINVEASFTGAATAQRALDAVDAAVPTPPENSDQQPPPAGSNDPGVFDSEELLDFDE